MSEVRFNLMVVESATVNPNTGLQHWVEPCDTLSEEDARRQWEVGSTPSDKIVAMCEVVLKDESEGTIEYPYAETYNALMGLNTLCNEPRVQDLLTRIFALGFEAGASIKARDLRKVLGM